MSRVPPSRLPSVPRSIQGRLTSNATNVIGTLNVLLAARDHGVRRVIFASSSSVYGANSELPKSEHHRAGPISPYATAKLARENYARSFHRVYGLETVACGTSTFRSPSGSGLPIRGGDPELHRRSPADRPPVIFGDGEQSRDFTYVENVVRANVLALAAPGPRPRLQRRVRRAITLNRLVAELRDLLGCEIEPVHADPRAADIRHSLADLSRAGLELGYEPSVRLREGLQRTIDYLRTEPRLSERTIGAM